MSSALQHIKHSKIGKLYDTIIHTGISPELGYLEHLRVRVFNTAALFFVLILTVHFVMACINSEPDAYFLIVYLLFTLPIFYLNYSQKFFTARIYALTVVPIFVLVGWFLNGFWIHATYMLVIFIFGVISVYDNLIVKAINIVYLLVLACIGMYFQLYYTPLYIDSFSFWDGFFTLVGTMLGIIWCWNLFFKEIVLKHKELSTINKELVLINDQLEASIHQNNLKTELLGIIAHDVRASTSSFNNLTHKVSYLIDTNDLDRLLSLGESIEIEGLSLFRNLDNLLNWVASIKDKIIPVPVEFNPTFIITTTINTFSPIIKRNNLQIINTINPSKRINTDEHIFKVIFQNILHNAIKYSRKNSNIYIKGYDEGPFCYFEIKNAGVGIDLTIVEQIRNGNNTNRVKNTGYGLGLGICFSLIELLSGTIEFQSSSKKGTTAIIKVPSTTCN